MIALAPAQQPRQIACHADEVVLRRAPNRVARAATRFQRERRDVVDVGRHVVAVHGDVQAVGRDVLPQGDHAAVKDAPERAVAMEVAAVVEPLQQGDGVAEQRIDRAGAELGIVLCALARLLETGLQRGRLFGHELDLLRCSPHAANPAITQPVQCGMTWIMSRRTGRRPVAAAMTSSSDWRLN